MDSTLDDSDQKVHITHELIDILPSGKTTKDYILSKINSQGKDSNDIPFFVFDIGKLIEIYQLWIRTFPSITPFYAVKANPDPILLSVLAQLGAGFDCASQWEIEQALSVVAPDKIIFANPCKPESHLRYAKLHSVSKMTFDNEDELHKISVLYPSASLGIRIKAHDESALWPLTDKFGCTIEEAYHLLKTAKELRLNVAGICFHVGCSARNPETYYTSLKDSKKVFDYAKSIGHNITYLDIGGGFPGIGGGYSEMMNLSVDQERDLLCKIGDSVKSGIDDFFNHQHDLVIMAEPGRLFCESCASLVVKVIGKRHRRERNCYDYYINDGIFGSLVASTYGYKLSPKIITMASESTQKYRSILWGPTCSSRDKVFETVLPELFIGDYLLCENVGAYSLANASTFNGCPKATSYYHIPEENPLQ